MPARGVRIRAPRPADAEALAKLVAANNRRHGLPDDRFTAEAARRDLFCDPPFLRARLAEAEDRAAVGVVLWCDGYESAYAARGGYVVDIYVRPELRRRGIGRALLAAAAAGVRAEGGVYLWWTAIEANDEARALYESVGAYVEGVRAHALTFAAFERLGAEAQEEPPGDPD